MQNIFCYKSYKQFKSATDKIRGVVCLSQLLACLHSFAVAPRLWTKCSISGHMLHGHRTRRARLVNSGLWCWWL